MRKFGFILMLAVIGATLLVLVATGTVSADVWPPG